MGIRVNKWREVGSMRGNEGRGKMVVRGSNARGRRGNEGK